MTLHSCLYEGEVVHRRRVTKPHAFRYRLFMVYLDLDELPTLFRGRWLWSSRRPNIAWFRRADYLGPPTASLAECVRDLAAERLGRRPMGSVRLLTHLRYFGFAMNPISLYYCYDADGQLDAVVAEVSNTPWNERHWYVLDARRPAGKPIAAEAAKEFHVSPFLEMHYDYRFQLSEPDDTLAVQITNVRRGSATVDFDAELRLRRRPFSAWNAARVLSVYPWMTLRVFAAIYWQALCLWLKGIPYVPHPGSTGKPLAATGSSFSSDASP